MVMVLKNQGSPFVVREVNSIEIREQVKRIKKKSNQGLLALRDVDVHLH